jgi:hypothetical protein
MSNQFKKVGSRTQSIIALREKMQESAPKSFRQDDDRYWKPELDKTGTGSAVIRFLPCQENDPAPYATLHTHGFQGPTSGKWYIENCPTSIVLDCPACKGNTELWNSGREEDKNLARSRKRKLNYISNILVMKDAKHPENEGKVFLYKYGKKIFEKIKDLAMPPEAFADMEPVNAFDPFEGANFKLRVTKQDGFPNYDKSSFDSPSPLFNGNEDNISALESKIYSLAEVVAVGQFKTHDDLLKHLTLVLGGGTATSPRKLSSTSDEEEVVAPRAAPVKTPRTLPTAKAKAMPAAASVSEDDEDDYFAKLAQGGEEDN